MRLNVKSAFQKSIFSINSVSDIDLNLNVKPTFLMLFFNFKGVVTNMDFQSQKCIKMIYFI